MTEQTFDLGFIGHNAEKIKALFSEYSEMPNQYGKFLKFENYTEYVVNEGVTAYTNCFEDEKHFNDMLTLRLLINYLEL